ncbi:arsenate reductase [Balneicella halophila]|uniref:Arsenate reductase n=1 Tax=Balneicella halophila TaxID=1537566 RepID=A0A7L4USG3_BALHA|nr:hypothetical protein [Balneicella halophila]PVX52442.1 arsenate reductase [Balneicella halophila]
MERNEILQPLIDYLQSKINDHQPIRLIFICTHNSRRSHLAQVWAQTLAFYYGIQNIICYSAGTEATAIFPSVIQSLQKSGFLIEKLSESDNLIYSMKYALNELPIIGFSKTLTTDLNPKSQFCAIMTCSQADNGCPFIVGADKRIPITYDDPKIFDNSPEQAEKYLERSKQIATELKYVFVNIKL